MSTPRSVKGKEKEEQRPPCSVYSFGYGFFGQCGVGDNKAQRLPVKVGGLEDVIKIECGDSHCVAIDKGIPSLPPFPLSSISRSLFPDLSVFFLRWMGDTRRRGCL